MFVASSSCSLPQIQLILLTLSIQELQESVRNDGGGGAGGSGGVFLLEQELSRYIPLPP